MNALLCMENIGGIVAFDPPNCVNDLTQESISAYGNTSRCRFAHNDHWEVRV